MFFDFYNDYSLNSNGFWGESEIRFQQTYTHCIRVIVYFGWFSKKFRVRKHCWNCSKISVVKPVPLFYTWINRWCRDYFDFSTRTASIHNFSPTLLLSLFFFFVLVILFFVTLQTKCKEILIQERKNFEIYWRPWESPNKYHWPWGQGGQYG